VDTPMDPPDGSITLDHAFVLRFVRELDERLRVAETHLTELDAAIGDADHGTNMTRGMHAAVAALDETPDRGIAAAFSEVGRALTRAIGGASGPLYGTVFATLGATLPPDVDAPALARGLREALHAVQRLGAAAVGDKTMVDAIAPAVTELEQRLGRGDDLAAALAAATRIAEEGARATIPLRARRGRASYLGVRSEGHQDPGATSSALVFGALRDAAAPPSAADGVIPR
jgi:phosphoenolpyruvate---glycerone phosphotransferase subunit DhaL